MRESFSGHLEDSQILTESTRELILWHVCDEYISPKIVWIFPIFVFREKRSCCCWMYLNMCICICLNIQLDEPRLAPASLGSVEVSGSRGNDKSPWIWKVSRNRRNNQIPWKNLFSRDFVVWLFLDTFRTKKCLETGKTTKSLENNVFFQGIWLFFCF